MTKDLEEGIDLAVLLRTKIRNTLYNNEIGFSMRNAGSRTAEQMAEELVEQLAGIAESLYKQREEVIEREARNDFGDKLKLELEPDLFGHDWERLNQAIDNQLTSPTNQKEER